VRVPLVVDQQVGRLEVAMEDAAGVGVRNRLGRLGDEAGGRAGVVGVAVDQGHEAAAGHELHGEVGLAVVLADLIDRDDARVVEQGDSLGLVLEAAELVVTGEESGLDHLQRHGSVERDLAGLVHHAHAAASELASDLVVAKVALRSAPRRASVVAVGAAVVEGGRGRRLAAGRVGAVVDCRAGVGRVRARDGRLRLGPPGGLGRPGAAVGVCGYLVRDRGRRRARRSRVRVAPLDIREDPREVAHAQAQVAQRVGGGAARRGDQPGESSLDYHRVAREPSDVFARGRPFARGASGLQLGREQFPQQRPTHRARGPGQDVLDTRAAARGPFGLESVTDPVD
jgi:hypothetical protein